MLTRRSLVLGSLGLLAGCALPGSGGLPDGRSSTGSFTSARMGGRSVGWAIAYPPGHRPGDRLPVVVSLHGRGGTHSSTFDQLGLGDVLDRVVDDGVAPFALASVDGGDHGYWHRRTDGTDAGAMLRSEFLPLLARRGLDVTRLGLYGWSMGGYGALLQAGRFRMPVRAVAVSSPALFESAGATAAGAFDGPADFAANDVFGHPRWLHGVTVRMDCGVSDPFYPATKAFAARLPTRPAGGFASGGHDADFWKKVAPDQFRFLGAAVA